MDLSLRSYVGGWKAIFLEDTTCLNELPASFFAYRKQQHRWTCGPVQLWRKTAYYIWHSSLPFHRKVCAPPQPDSQVCRLSSADAASIASALRIVGDLHAHTVAANDAVIDRQPSIVAVRGWRVLRSASGTGRHPVLLFRHPEVRDPLGVARLLLHAGPPQHLHPGGVPPQTHTLSPLVSLAAFATFRS